jgi:putative hemolysin
MEITLALIGLSLSFFFAGAETAYITTSKIRFEIWVRRRLRSALLAEKYFRQPELYLSTTLVGNNIANVITSSYAMVLLINYFDETVAWAVITLCVLTVGEIIPKVLFRTHANRLILKIIYLIKFFHFLLSPIIFIANKISSYTLKLLQLSRHTNRIIFYKQDIAVMMREAKISGVVDEDEHKIISKVLSLPDRLVREAMVPRTAIRAIEYKDGLKKLKNLIAESGNTKIPVYKQNIDNIIGIVFLYDLFFKPKSLREIIKPVVYTPENKKCNELLREFRQTNTSAAIVIDEYGGTAGIVTIEDLIEQLFGEIEEIPWEEDTRITALNQFTYRVKADESVENINEELEVSIPTGHYDTLAGYIFSQLGHIPKNGEQIVLDECRIVVTKVDLNRIIEVRIVKK